MNDTCFRVDTPSVIHEMFDDELVAIHLDTGAYHSLVGAGRDAFLLLSEDATLNEVADALETRYDASREVIVAGLHGFFRALLAEKLIVSVEVPRAHGPFRLECGSSRLPLTGLSLEAHHDLQSLFLLDPVHEVGEQGWPQVAATDTSANELEG